MKTILSLILATCLCAAAPAAIIDFRLEVTDWEGFLIDPYSPSQQAAASWQTSTEHATRLGTPLLRLTNLSPDPIGQFQIDIQMDPQHFDVIQVNSMSPGTGYSVAIPFQDGHGGASSPTLLIDFANGLDMGEHMTIWADLDGGSDYRDAFWDDSWLRVDSFQQQFPDFTIPFGPSAGTFTEGQLDCEWLAVPMMYDPFETAGWYKMESTVAVPEPSTIVIFTIGLVLGGFCYLVSTYLQLRNQ